MNRLFSFCIAIFISLSAVHTNAQDSRFDDLTLNGLATYQKLRKDYYIGALYLESSNHTAQDIIAAPGSKRLDIRILVNKWSPRRFAKEWTSAILLNNEQSALEKLTSQIQSFTNTPRQDLRRGDRITIDMAEGRHTTIYLNNHRVYRTVNNAFFYAILKTWIGSKPPSSEFKQNILKLKRDDLGVELLTQYEELSYSDNRKRQIMAWTKQDKNTDTSSSSSSFAPPGQSIRSSGNNNSDDEAQQARAKAEKAQKAAEEKAQAKALAQAKAEKEAAEAKAAAAAAELAKAKAEKARSEAMGEYQSVMYRLIAKNVRYPKRSQQRGEKGRVVVKVELDREGKIVNLSQQESSPFTRLNNAAEKAFKVSEPFAPMPPEVSGNTFEFIFPINF